MHKFTKYIFFIFLFAPFFAHGQQTSDIYRLAENAYNLGQFEVVDSLLSKTAANFKDEYRIGAYRLLSLSSLYQDKPKQAEEYARLLLTVDPYYTSYGDAPRFMDLIQNLKHGKGTTITTASQQAETIEEAPVPVTLITEEMIRMSGARTLLDLLELYVPGVNRVDGFETNFSMKGMYGYSQENVLIMRNGVRLNSYSTNSVSPDYRIMLDNIKQIEILRGPASSLYGNVALSAVVNIITKSGNDIDGIRLSGGAGNTGIYKGNVLWGKQLLNTQLLLWGSIYGSKGYRHDIAADDPLDSYGIFRRDAPIYIDGFNGKPAYDLGFTLNWNHLKFQLSRQYSKRIPTYTNMIMTSPYEYERFGKIGGNSPGRGITSTNANIKYINSWKNFDFEANAIFNQESTSAYNILCDSIPPLANVAAGILPRDDEFIQSAYITQGGFLLLNWRNNNVEANVKGIYNYKSKIGQGNFLLGAQYDKFNMYHNEVILGDHYNRIALSMTDERVAIFKNEKESGMSVFAQLKHRFNPHLIFNGGVRYDYKKRYNNDNQSVISPRLAFIWIPNNKYNIKLGYGRSFVDSPYFYRVTKVIFNGNEFLKPEYLDNIQLTGNFSFPSLNLSYEGNIYYNDAKDVVVLGTEGFYVNTGAIKSIGIENVIKYDIKGFNLHANVSLQRVLSGAPTLVTFHSIYNSPNVITRFMAAKSIVKNLWLIAKPSFYTKQTASMMQKVAMRGTEPASDEVCNIPANLLLDAGIRYDHKKFELSLYSYNLFNHKYRLGGDRTPVLQPGRTLVGTITYKLHK